MFFEFHIESFHIESLEKGKKNISARARFLIQRRYHSDYNLKWSSWLSWSLPCSSPKPSNNALPDAKPVPLAPASVTPPAAKMAGDPRRLPELSATLSAISFLTTATANPASSETALPAKLPELSPRSSTTRVFATLLSWKSLLWFSLASLDSSSERIVNFSYRLDEMSAQFLTNSIYPKKLSHSFFLIHSAGFLLFLWSHKNPIFARWFPPIMSPYSARNALESRADPWACDEWMWAA